MATHCYIEDVTSQQKEIAFTSETLLGCNRLFEYQP